VRIQALQGNYTTPQVPVFTRPATSYGCVVRNFWFQRGNCARPAGQDRLIPIFLATLAIRQQSPHITFDSAAGMLDTFGMQQGGSQYRRLVGSLQRIFGATIFFGTNRQREHAAVFHRARFNFMSEARIWYSRDPEAKLLPGDCQNRIILSDEFYREILSHPIPTDLEAARVLSSSPAALDLFMWLSYRCFTARGRERVPLFGDFGLVSQLGSAEYARPRKFRRSWRAGWTWCMRCGLTAQLRLTRMEPGCSWTRRTRFCRREVPMRGTDRRAGIWPLRWRR
jgi:hypothetical protein